MRRHLMFGTVFSAALAVAASAQTPAEQAGSAAKSDSAQTITVSGCLRSADAKATGTSGSAAGAPSTSSSSNRAGGFILTDVSPSGTEAAAATPPTGTPTGTAGAAGSSSEKKGYRLTGSSSELSSLVGKRVEVTGSLSGSAAGAAPSSPAAGSMSSSQNMPQFRVTSVKEATGGASCPSESK